MAKSIPEIYPKLREALEQYLHDQAEWESKFAELRGKCTTSENWQQTRREATTQALRFVEKFRKVTEMDLAEEDIVSMEDLAVACAKPLLWHTDFWCHSSDFYWKSADGTWVIPLKKADDRWGIGEYVDASHTSEYFYSCPYEHFEGKRVAEDLLCLLKPVEEELLPLRGPTDLRIWEIFAAAKMQQRQFNMVAAYAGYTRSQAYQRSLPETNELVRAMQGKFKDLLSSFQQVQLHMERQGLLSPELRTKMTGFAMRLKSCCRAAVGNMTSGNYDRSQATQRWSQLSSEAAQIAAQVKELTSDANSEVNSLGSWSVIPDSERLTENLEVGSVGSFSSVGSQTSCLSGHGGPHCFLPSYLFKSLQADDKLSPVSSGWANAKDLQKGTKILAADGTRVEVVKLEVQKTSKLLELEIDDAVPFTTTPSHRIMIPSDGDDTTVKAVDLKVGSWVMCSDDTAKKVKGMRFIHVEEQEVLAITFHPDKAVACFLPPEEPGVLSKGRTQKNPRRGGMGSRGSTHEMMSIPDTAAGEYEDRTGNIGRVV